MKHESLCTSYSIASLPREDRPRERLARYGTEAMSSAELIAVILGSGTKGRSVLQLAHDLLALFGDLKNLADATAAELCQIKGLGMAKALQLKAALGIGVRVSKQDRPPKYRVEHPIHAYNLVKEELLHEKREIFMVILLDTKGFLICREVVAIGTLSQTLVHPREVFYPAIRHKAASLILVHNHPSGDPTPSHEDIELTGHLIKAGKLISIPVNDHLVTGDNAYTSLRQKGVKFYTETY